MQVLAYLKAENEFCDAVMSDTKQLREELFAEMKGRIQEEDSSVPVRDAGYYYYTRTLEGKQYGVHCRRRIEEEEGELVDENTTMDTRCSPLGTASAAAHAPLHHSASSVHDTMQRMTNKECSVPEEVLLDENKEAAKHAYYQVADVSISNDGKLVAFSEDTVGSELYSLRILDVATRRPQLAAPIPNTQGQVEWASDSRTFFYVTQDEKQRPNKVRGCTSGAHGAGMHGMRVVAYVACMWCDRLRPDTIALRTQVFRKVVGSTKAPKCVFEEPDEEYHVGLIKTHDKELILIQSSAAMQNEIRYVRSAEPLADFKVRALAGVAPGHGRKRSRQPSSGHKRSRGAARRDTSKRPTRHSSARSTLPCCRLRTRVPAVHVRAARLYMHSSSQSSAGAHACEVHAARTGAAGAHGGR
jgi:protease II